LVWLFAGLSFSTALALFLQTHFPSGFTRSEWVTLTLSVLVCTACFAFEYLSDAFIAFRTTLYFLVTLLGAVAGVAWLRGSVTTAQLTAAGVSSVLISTGVALWAHTQFGPSPWPNILAQRYPDAPHYEMNGVQFAFVPSTVRAKAGATFEFQLVAQNTLTQARSIGLELGFSSQFSEGREPVLLPIDPELELAPGEVAEMTVRALARQGAAGKHALRFEVTVAGRGGHRKRRARVPRYSPDAPLLLEALVVFAGVTVGLKERGITVDIVASELSASESPARVHRTSLWRPDKPV
jgi:hypothetical protein